MDFNARISSRGQVLIIFVFAIIGLIAMTGLAIDGSNILSDRRHAQNAADTASLAAALYRNNWSRNNGACLDTINTATGVLPGCAPDTVNYALNLAGKNGYDNNPLNQNRVDVYSPPLDPPYNDCGSSDFDCHDYVQVVIQDDVNTWFAKVLGIGQLHNQVEAVALAHYSPQSDYYGGNTLVELATGHSSCPSDFDVGGSGSVTLNGGGIFVNSTNTSCAYKQTSCNASVIQSNGATIEVSQPGGWDISHCAGAPAPTQSSLHFDFPPARIFDTQPTECGTPGTSSTTGGVTTYSPGSYGTFPTVNGPSILQSGVYCINDFKTTKDITSDPGGVFIYIRPTGQIDISGGKSPTSLPKILLSPLTSGPYEGFLIYADWDQSSSLNGNTCTIAGGVGSEFSGMIFAPYCQMNLTGSSTADGNKAQIVAGTMTLSGNLDLTFTYDSSKLPKIPEKDFTGLSH